MWIRDINFNNLKDLLHIINKYNGKLRAIDLEKIAIEQKVLVKIDGSPLAKSPRYFYRKALEHLDLAYLKGRKYYLSDNPLGREIISGAQYKILMTECTKEYFREIVLSNKDCRRYFFDLCMENTDYSIQDLRAKGKPIFVKTKSMLKFEPNTPKKKKIVTLYNENQNTVELDDQDKIFAIYEGLRKWSLNLEITNEYMIDYVKGRIIYPVNPQCEDYKINKILWHYIEQSEPESSWSTIYIPHLIESIIIETRYPINHIKDYISQFVKSNYKFVVCIKSSTAFIDINTPFETQDIDIRKLYLYQNGIGYISHLKIKNEIIRESKNE